jgi:hypothetical protein
VTRADKGKEPEKREERSAGMTLMDRYRLTARKTGHQGLQRAVDTDDYTEIILYLSEAGRFSDEEEDYYKY